MDLNLPFCYAKFCGGFYENLRLANCATLTMFDESKACGREINLGLVFFDE